MRRTARNSSSPRCVLLLPLLLLTSSLLSPFVVHAALLDDVQPNRHSGSGIRSGSDNLDNHDQRRKVFIATMTDKKENEDEENNTFDDFTANHVIEALLQRGDEVIVLKGVTSTMDPPRNDKQAAADETTTIPLTKTHMTFPSSSSTTDESSHLSAVVYHGDFSKNITLEQIVKQQGGPPTHIVYFLAQPEQKQVNENEAKEEEEDEDWKIHRINSSLHVMLRLLEMAVHNPVESFVFASTSAIYDTNLVENTDDSVAVASIGQDGKILPVLRDEDERVDYPLSTAAATQKAAELYAYTWRHLYNVKTTALRLFPSMSLTTSEDIALGVVRAMDRPMESYEIINLGASPEQCTSASLSSPSFINKKNQIRGVSAERVLAGEQEDTKDAAVDVNKDRADLTAAPPMMCASISKAVALLEYKTTSTPSLSDKDPVDAITSEAKENKSRVNTLSTAQTLPPVTPWQEVPVLEPHTGKKKVLVTGAAGFIGSHVADFLLARGDDVVIIDEVNDYYDVNIKEGNLKMLQTKYDADRVKVYRGDICNETLVRHIYETEQPKWICHLAARAGVRPSIEDPYVYVHSNIQGTTRLLELSREYGVENFVFASSSSVYGGSKSHYFSEDERVDNPISPYAASKKSCELLSYSWHLKYQLNITGLRFFTVYGPRGRPDMAPFKFVDRISQGLPLQQFGDGTSSRDYTYIDDIVNGVVRAVDRPYPYQIFNLGKGSGTKLSDFIHLVEKYTGTAARIQVLPDQPGDVPYTCADMHKAQRLLGYTSSVPFEEGIKRTVEWYQEAYPQNVKKLGAGGNDRQRENVYDVELPSSKRPTPDIDEEGNPIAFSASFDEEPTVTSKDIVDDEDEEPSALTDFLEIDEKEQPSTLTIDSQDEDLSELFPAADNEEGDASILDSGVDDDDDDDSTAVSESLDVYDEEESLALPVVAPPTSDTKAKGKRENPASIKVSQLVESEQNDYFIEWIRTLVYIQWLFIVIVVMARFAYRRVSTARTARRPGGVSAGISRGLTSPRGTIHTHSSSP